MYRRNKKMKCYCGCIKKLKKIKNFNIARDCKCTTSPFFFFFFSMNFKFFGLLLENFYANLRIENSYIYDTAISINY